MSKRMIREATRQPDTYGAMRLREAASAIGSVIRTLHPDTHTCAACGVNVHRHLLDAKLLERLGPLPGRLAELAKALERGRFPEQEDRP